MFVLTFKTKFRLRSRKVRYEFNDLEDARSFMKHAKSLRPDLKPLGICRV